MGAAKRTKSIKSLSRLQKDPPVPPRPESPGVPLLEHFYPLAADPELYQAGIAIGARAIPRPPLPPQLRILFRAGDQEASVDCVHVAVYAGPLDVLPPEAELAQVSEQHPVTLTPEEHFFALDSYVAGIAEMGLGRMFAAAEESTGNLVGFNALMQAQVLRALLAVAPAATANFLLWVLDAAGSARSVNVVSWIGRSPAILACLASSGNRDLRVAVAQHSYTSGETLAALASDPDPVVRQGVAQNERVSVIFLTGLVDDPDASVRLAVARNECASFSILTRLAKDSDGSVRLAVAQNWMVTPLILTQLAQDSDPRVRGAIAGSFQTSPILVEMLARDQEASVRWAAASGPVVSPESLMRLARDLDPYVRAAVAENPRTPSTIYKSLEKDNDPLVRDALLLNLNSVAAAIRPRLECTRSPEGRDLFKFRCVPTYGSTREEVVDPWEMEHNFRQNKLAGNQNAPLVVLAYLNGVNRNLLKHNRRWQEATPEELVAFIHSPDVHVRRGIAERHLPPEFLILLAQDEDSEVRRNVADNFDAPTEVFRLLACMNDEDLLHRLRNNLNLPAKARELVRDPNPAVRQLVALHRDISGEILAALAGDPDLTVRQVVAANRHTPIECIVRLAEDPEASVRAIVAQNERNPVAVLSRLAEDPDASVRWALAQNWMIPPPIRAQLAQDSDPRVRGAIAGSFQTAPALAEKLARDHDASVRWAAASGPVVSPETLVHLASDLDSYVRAAVAENLRTPPDTLRQLAQDRDDLVRDSLFLNLNYVPRIFPPLSGGKTSPDRRRNLVFLYSPAYGTLMRKIINPLQIEQVRERKVANNPNAPLAVLASILGKGNILVLDNRRWREASLEDLVTLARSPDENVQRGIALHNVPSDDIDGTWDEIIDEWDEEVQDEVEEEDDEEWDEDQDLGDLEADSDSDYSS